MKCAWNLEGRDTAPSRSHESLHEDGLHTVLKDERICQSTLFT